MLCLCRSPSLRRLSSLIVKVVVCGNCLSPPVPAATGSSGNDRSQLEATASLSAALQEGDIFFAQLASSVSLSLMPGPSDPTTYALPQVPLHAALLPLTRQYQTAGGATNPHAFAVDGVRLPPCVPSSLSPPHAPYRSVSLPLGFLFAEQCVYGWGCCMLVLCLGSIHWQQRAERRRYLQEQFADPSR